MCKSYGAAVLSRRTGLGLDRHNSLPAAIWLGCPVFISTGGSEANKSYDLNGTVINKLNCFHANQYTKRANEK